MCHLKLTCDGNTVRVVALIWWQACPLELYCGGNLARVIELIWQQMCHLIMTCFIRYPGLTQILHCITCVDDGVWLWWWWKSMEVYFPILLKIFESGDWWWQNTKGSRAWQQFWIVLVLQCPSGLGVARLESCWILNEDSKCSELHIAVCVKYTLQKKVSCLQQVSLYSIGSYPGQIRVSGSSRSVILTWFQPWCAWRQECPLNS